VKLGPWFRRGVIGGETLISRSVLAVGGGSREGGRERVSRADSALGFGFGLGRLGLAKERRGERELGH
jgi:hypothetical protein